MPVIKSISSNDFRAMLRQQEQMDLITFDPQHEGEFIIDPRGKVAFRYSDRNYGVSMDAFVGCAKALSAMPNVLNRVLQNNQDLAIRWMNFFLKDAEFGKTRMGFAQQNGVVRAFAAQEMLPITDLHIIDKLEEVIGPNLTLWHASPNLFHSSYSVLTGEHHPVRPGDVAQTGVTIDNSYALVTPLRVSAYIQILRCTNGAISTETTFARTRPGYAGDAPEAIDDWLAMSLEQAIGAGTGEVQQLNDMLHVDFGDPDDPASRHLSESMDSIFAEYTIPGIARKVITERSLDEQPSNLYDLWSIITDYASNSEEAIEDESLARRMMRVGGRVAAHTHFCESCHRVLA